LVVLETVVLERQLNLTWNKKIPYTFVSSILFAYFLIFFMESVATYGHKPSCPKKVTLSVELQVAGGTTIGSCMSDF